MDYAVLREELTNDPLTRGYSGMSDAQAADSLNTKNRQRDPASVPSSLILTGMVPSEWAALTADQKQYLGYVFSLDQIDIRTGSQARVALLAMFAAGSQTRTNITNLLTNLVSRADELDLGDIVRPGDIASVRAS